MELALTVEHISELMKQLTISQCCSVDELITGFKNLNIIELNESNCIQNITRDQLLIILEKRGYQGFPFQSKQELILTLLKTLICKDVTITGLKQFLNSVWWDPRGTKDVVISRVVMYAITQTF